MADAPPRPSAASLAEVSIADIEAELAARDVDAESRRDSGLWSLVAWVGALVVGGPALAIRLVLTVALLRGPSRKDRS